MRGSGTTMDGVCDAYARMDSVRFAGDASPGRDNGVAVPLSGTRPIDQQACTSFNWKQRNPFRHGSSLC